MKALLALILFTLPLAGQLRIDARGFQMSEPELREVFDAAMSALPKAPGVIDPPLFLSRHRDGPITLYERTPRGEVAIQLDSEDYYYAQLIYQFAHELAHVRARFSPTLHEHKWLEETLCETASLFVLRRLHRDWADQAPSAVLAKYRPHLATYAERVIKTRPSLTPENSPTFYQKHRDTLRNSHTERALNGAFANLILPLFEKAPRSWEILATFPRQKGASLQDHFAAWRATTPAKHHPFLNQLQAIFITPAN